MNKTIVIRVNGKDHQIPKAYEIAYHELCQLADKPAVAQPIIVYMAGPLTAGMVRPGEVAPLKNHAVYSVATIDNV